MEPSKWDQPVGHKVAPQGGTWRSHEMEAVPAERFATG